MPISTQSQIALSPAIVENSRKHFNINVSYLQGLYPIYIIYATDLQLTLHIHIRPKIKYIWMISYSFAHSQFPHSLRFVTSEL